MHLLSNTLTFVFCVMSVIYQIWFYCVRVTVSVIRIDIDIIAEIMLTGMNLGHFM